LAVNPEGGVYTSDNYGLSWNDLTPNIDPKVESGFGLWSGFIHDNDIVLSYFIYSTSEFGIFKSTNRGETWVKIKLPNLTSNYRYKLMLRDGIYYAIGESEVCESEDSGDSWKVIVTVPTSDYRDGITDFYKSGKLMMYNWTGNGENNFMVSEDTGKTWSSYQNNMDRNISVTNFLVFRDTIFASTGGDGIWKRDLDHILYVRNLEGSNKYFTINQNYPNPFNPTTNIDFVIPKPAYTTLKIYDLLGRDVVTIINEVLNPGQYSKKWTAERISSGIYFCILKSGNYSATIKLILQK
jgi:hypothetical protein